MKDHELREFINRLADCARLFAGADQLRERIADVVLPVVSGIEAELAQLRAEKAASAVPKEFIAWLEAYGDYVQKLEVYNAKLSFSKQHVPFPGLDMNDEYQAFTAAQNKAHRMLIDVYESSKHLLQSFPVPTPATVPDEWREVLQECADDLAIELDMRYQSRHQYTSEQRRYDNEMQLVLRARALLQSTKEKK